MQTHMNKRLHTETINGTCYRVIERPSGTIQVILDFPPGMSAGFPECFYEGDIEGARAFWKTIDRRPINPLTGLRA